MSKDWSYARMTADASSAGGPDAWIDTIKNNAYQEGASDMLHKLIAPLILLGIGIGGMSVIGFQKIKKRFLIKKSEKILAQSEADQAEKFLKKELQEVTEKHDMNTKTH